MKNMKIALLIALIHVCACLLAGCWNYKEVEQLAIVSGVAIDKAEDDKILVTVEITNVHQDPKQSILKPVYIQAAGNTFFDAVRSMVSIEHKNQYHNIPLLHCMNSLTHFQAKKHQQQFPQ